MKDLEGKTILLTGATEGIGKAAALEFARRGATLAIVARNPEKGQQVASELGEAGAASVELIQADLSILDEVRAAAAAFRARHGRLDVLVNNAGAIFQKHQLSADGLELTFTLNHLAYFLLTTELLDLIGATPGARVVSTSSGAHHVGRIDFEQLATRPSGRAGFRAYGDSKLCNVLFTRELARRLPPSATANVFHPGFVRSGFAKNNGRFADRLMRMVGVFARSPERGARTLVWLATHPDAAAHNGEYFFNEGPARVSSQGRDDVLAARLWSFSEELCAEERRRTA